MVLTAAIESILDCVDVIAPETIKGCAGARGLRNQPPEAMLVSKGHTVMGSMPIQVACTDI